MKGIKKRIILILFLSTSVLICDGQPDNINVGQLFFKHISTEQGLPQSSVNDIIRDSRGFVWMATEDGLSRFDGTEFRTFRHDPSDSTSLSHNVVHFIEEETATGNLWIGTVSGINYFDRSLEKFKVYKTDNPPGTVYANAALDKERSRLWLACTVGGLRYLDLSSQRVVEVKTPDLDNKTVWNVEISGDTLLIATLHGLQILDLDSQQISTFYNGSSVRALLADGSGWWFGTEGNGLAWYDRIAKTTTYYNRDNGGTNNNDIWSLAKDRDGNLWIGTDGGGLNVLANNRKTSRFYVHSEFDERSLSYNTVRSIFIERNGSVWLGTYNGGVNYHEVTPLQFQLFRKEFSSGNSLRNNVVSAFAEADDGTIWIGTDGGGLHYLKDGVVYRYDLPARLSEVNVITALKSDGQGLWIGSFQNGLIYLDGHGGVKQYKHDPEVVSSLAANTVWSIQKDSQGYLWVGTNRGVNRFDPKTGVFHHIDNPLKSNVSKLFKNVQAQTILITSDHTLWVGSYGLLMAYLPASDSVVEVKGIDERGRTLPDLRVKSLLEDDGRIWIGTYGSGLCQYNMRSNKLYILDKRDGLPDDIVLSVQKGEPGSLWLGTNTGLVHFHEADSIFSVFDSNYGVQGTTFNRNAAIRTTDDRLMFGGTQGFNIFRPHAINDNQNSLAVVFTNFSIFNKQVNPGSDYLKESITETNVLDLPHTDSRLITLQFSAFNFLSPDKIVYAYKLEGFNNQWQTLGNANGVTFTNLDPGPYTLSIRASSNGRTWGPERSLRIIIQTPWWKSVYARWSAFVVFVAGGYAYYRYRTYRLQVRKKELEALVRVQGQEIQRQNHDLAAQNEELKAQNDEMTAQQQKITEQNILLSEATQKLQEVNQSLEQVVSQRTEKLNETIRHLNKTIKELDAFVYSASHDLTAPMKSVLGLVVLIRRQNQDEEIGMYIDHIERSVKKLEDVTLNMIQHSQNSNLTTAYEEVDLRALIQDCISSINFYTGMETMKFLIEFGEKEAIVMSDPDRLRIILNNLISNCVKYRDDGKLSNDVRMTFENGRTTWKLEVLDNGIGIDKQYLSRVFEMFFRANDRSQGSGLGLFIVKETVERLNGEVYVDSEKYQWTKFTIVIPHDNLYLRKK